MSDEAGLVPDEAIREMVEIINPAWHVDGIERSNHGSDLVAILNVRTASESLKAVLKATTAGWVDPVVARSEPRFLNLLSQKTAIPVPVVYGYCDEHPELPAPFCLMSYEDGMNFEGRAEELTPAARETVLREAGEHLADLHNIGPLPKYGTIGVKKGDLVVLDTDRHSRYDDFREKLLDDVEDTLDSLTEGGFFPDLAEEPDRFADLVPPLREYLRETIPNLPTPDPPRYNYWDYRYGNLLLDCDTGHAQAVLDWANLSAADPAYNLAKVEANLLSPDRDDDARTDALCDTFRSAYSAAREDWTFDEETYERMHIYRLTDRLDSMACLPLWYQDASPSARDERATEHRSFVSKYL